MGFAVFEDDVHGWKQQRVGQFRTIGQEFGEQRLGDAEMVGQRPAAAGDFSRRLQQFYGAGTHQRRRLARSGRERHARSENRLSTPFRSSMTRSTARRSTSFGGIASPVRYVLSSEYKTPRWRPSADALPIRCSASAKSSRTMAFDSSS